MATVKTIAIILFIFLAVLLLPDIFNMPVTGLDQIPINNGLEPGTIPTAESNVELGAPLNSSIQSITKSDPWAHIDFTSRKLTNNVWGSGKNENLTSSIYLNHNSSFGYAWNRNLPRSNQDRRAYYPYIPVSGLAAVPGKFLIQHISRLTLAM